MKLPYQTIPNFLKKGFNLLEEGKPQESLDFFLKCLGIESEEEVSLGIGLSQIALNRDKEAEETLTKVISSTNNPYAHYHLGLLFFSSNQAVAVHHLKKSSNNKDLMADSLLLLSKLFKNENNLMQAKKCLAQGILNSTKKATFMYALGVIYLEEKHYQVALKYFQESFKKQQLEEVSMKRIVEIFLYLNNIEKAKDTCALILKKYPSLQNTIALAKILEKQKLWVQACLVYRSTANLYPKSEILWLSWGEACIHCGNWPDAQDAFRHVLDLSSKNYNALVGIGTTYQNLDQHKRALSSFLKAIEIIPDSPHVLIFIGIAYNNLGEYEKALHFLEKGNELKTSSSSLFNLASYHLTQGNIAKAEESLLKSYKLHPTSLKLVHLGDCRFFLKDIKGGEDYYERALKSSPDSHFVLYHTACLLLIKENFEEGWELYDNRLKTKTCQSITSFKIDQFPKEVKNVLIITECGIGLGEFFLFSYFFSELKKYPSITIDIETDARLIPLYKRSFPEINFIPKEITFKEDYESFFPIGHLGKFFGKNKATFPKKAPYLITDSQQSQYFKEKYKKLFPNKRLIGFSWKSINDNVGFCRSIPLETLISSLKHPDIIWICLQVEMTEEEEKLLKKQNNIYIDDKVNFFEDVDSVAAIVSGLECIVSIDNTLANLCGALGVPTLTLLVTNANWKWGLSRNEPIWYDNMQLIRQKELNKWDDVLSKVQKILF
jgi:tetratricopeptide (TPR) repeat protein